MSVKYTPVQWTRSKWAYDAALVAGAGLFLWIFLYVTPEALSYEFPINPQIHNARAFGACAFLMLTIVLCIGPLARLDTRFLPLLYNRRHFGVITCAVALTHAFYVLNWYFAFSPTDKFAAVLGSNTSFAQVAGFPFEILGVFSLICLLLLAATSHDFWLKFLTPPIWKGLHYLVYPAYAALVGHIGLGVLQDQQNVVFPTIFVGGAATAVILHVAAALKDKDQYPMGQSDDWVHVADAKDIPEGRAKIAILPDGNRVAVFRHEGKLSAIANACAHQNGPLGEGRIIACLVTCPWHGFQYDVTNGRSPAPFTETIPTYNLRLDGPAVLVHPKANPPGTYGEPVPAPAEARS